MRQCGIVLLLGFVALFAQGSIFRGLLPGGVSPDFMVILTVYLAFFQGSVAGAFVAFALGLQFDIFSGVVLGPKCAALVFIYGIFAAASQRIFIEAFVAAFVAVFFASLVQMFVYLTLLLEVRPVGGEYLLSAALTEALYTAIVAPVILPFLRALSKPKRDRGYSSPNYIRA